MIITEDLQDVHVGGAQSVDVFTIKASAKAFQILSSNLYSNPLGSMIRELSTNAYDAHVMVNKKDIPFQLTLPNSLEPSFKIRDFGPGLSHNDIMNVYTTIFESTKTSSNDVVGCLGLGSKSPFGVADSFTVTSYHDNKKIIYSAFLNHERIPSIAKFAELESDEPSGLEIEIAISEEDFRVFNREVNQQLKYFITKPIILGNGDFKWNVQETYLYSGSNWKMVQGSDYARVIQGQISYPISTRDMGKTYDNADPAIKEILSRSVLFEVPIGDVNIAPSREALSYDTRTSENIIKAAQTILDELPKQIAQAIQECPNRYLAKLKYEEIMSDLCRGYNNNIQRSIKGSQQIVWNDIDVSSPDIDIIKDNIISAVQYSKNYNGRFTKSIISAYQKYVNGSRSKDPQQYWQFRVRNLKNVMWVYATEFDKAIDARAKQWFNEHYNSNSTIYIIKTHLTINELADEFGLDTKDFIIAADLPKVKRSQSDPGVDKTIFVQKYCGGWSKSDQWETVTVPDLNDLDGYFVNLNGFDIEDQAGNSFGEAKPIINAAKELQLIENKPVYGLRTMNQKRSHSLKCLFHTIRSTAKSTKLADKYNFGDSKVVSKLQSDWSALEKLYDMIKHDSPIKPLIQAIISTRNSKLSYDAEKLINKLNLHDITIDMVDVVNDIDDRYSMIGIMGYYPEPLVLSRYIRQIDSMHGLDTMPLVH